MQLMAKEESLIPQSTPCLLLSILNSKIDEAKAVYIQTTLNQTVKKTKKFWKLIKGLIDKDDCADITAYTFTNPDTGIIV